MKTYTKPADNFDWCFSCDYFLEVASVYFMDQLDEEVPLCDECTERLGN